MHSAPTVDRRVYRGVRETTVQRMGRTKEPDEVFCEACGKAIKERAELCPHCGVRNAGDAAAVGSSHNPVNYETTVGPSWYYAIAVPTLFTIPSFVLFSQQSSAQTTGLSFVFIFAFLASVFAPIIGAYFDRQYVRANSTWDPSLAWQVALFFLYPGNVVIAAFYLYRRHEVLGEP
ncbi:zinc ribbon domain-containing protein [Halobaculum halobium]|uniref:Zinc ribbon domain-containing protein n=3 Tax=Halobaculum halobium TaxID=3032281 RepID=A0ABD5TDY6_9EURY|nr:zinc ribbon domain-containing protein [Halobaculum sp. SYNS20]